MADPWTVQSVEPVSDPWTVVDVKPLKPKARRSVYGEVAGAMANVNRGLGFGDEVAGAVGSTVNRLTGRQIFAPQRPLEDAYAADRPGVAALARGTGMAATAAIPGGASANMLATSGRVTNALGSGSAAALTGAGYAAVDRGTVRERVKAATDPVMLGASAVLGGAGGAFAKRISQPEAPKAGKPPSPADLTTQRKAAYKAVEDSGHRYDAAGFAGMVNDVKAKLVKEQFDPDFHVPVQTMLNKLDAKVKAGFAPTLSELDELRKFVGKNVGGAGDKNVRRLGGVITRGIDTFIEGEGGPAAALIGKARDLYKRENKVATVTKALDKSARQAKRSGSGGNYDNATRIKMDQILEKNNFLSGEERKALEDVVMGGRVQNAMRAYGKTSPLTGGVAAQINLYGGLATGGAGAVLHSAPSSVAKLVADKITANKVKAVIDLMASGGTREQLLTARKVLAGVASNNAGVAALRREIAARLSRGAGIAVAGGR